MELTHGERRALELMQSLIAGTRAGSAKWQLGADNTTFVFSRKAGSVSIWSRDHDGQPPYGFTLYDRAGVVIEILETQTVTDAFGMEVPAAWNDALATLYELARSDALDIDAVVDGLLQAVEEGEPPPPEPATAEDDIPF